MKDDYPITLLCAVLGISRSGYHAWDGGHRDRRSARDRYLGKCIDQAFEQSRRTYGYPRMTLELRANGERVGKTRVARLMRDAGLQGRQRRAFRPRTTQSDHDGPIAPNRLARIAAITAVNQVWQTDITYVRTDEGWLYLAMVMDAFSTRIIGWAFSADLGTQFVVDALLMAVAQRGGSAARQVVLHSDRGVQYSSARFRSELAQHEILASMSRRGNCYDNSKAEAFFSTLKIELVYRTRYASRQQARSSIFEWIEAFYNLRRRHTSIGGISPVDFEHQLNIK
jgi:transposase InsO family protein